MQADGDDRVRGVESTVQIGDAVQKHQNDGEGHEAVDDDAEYHGARHRVFGLADFFGHVYDAVEAWNSSWSVGHDIVGRIAPTDKSPCRYQHAYIERHKGTVPARQRIITGPDEMVILLRRQHEQDHHEDDEQEDVRDPARQFEPRHEPECICVDKTAADE